MATLNNVITNANGCVGIGTSSPAQLLELKKTTGSAIALLNYNDSVKFNINASSAGAGYVGMVTNHDLIFVTNDTERARLNTNGNIGIGTSSPAYKLEVLGLVNVVSAPGSYGAMFRARDSVTLGTESFGGVHFTSNPGTDYTIGKWTTAAGAGLLQIRDQSGNKFFTIDGAGNVGIGTTTLSSLLTLHGTYPQLVANNPSTGSGVVIQLKDNGRDAGFMGHSTTTARLQFGSRGIANTQMTLDYNGNLGIGTTSPTRKLHIDGGATTTVGIYIDANGISGTDIEQSSDAFRFQIRDNIPALFYTNNTERIRIASDGNVGIGTTAPAYKLEVNGSLYATRLSGSAMFTTNGKGRFYGTASYALAAPAGSSLTGQTDSATPFETSLGYQAGNVNTGTGNTAIGYQALLNNTTGTGSIAIGYQALYTNTRGKRNIAIGYEALRTTQGSTDVYGDPIGDENVAIGYQAARAAFNINRVVAIGHRALANNLAGGNVAIGWRAMESNVGTANSNLGILNTAVGTMALFSNTSGNSNSAFGYNALTSNITGNENTAVGHRASLYNSTGKSNGSFGSYALYYNQVGNNNNAFGNYCLYTNGGNNNSAFGHRALYSNTTGTNNCAFGSGSLWKNTSGTKNTAIGGNAGSTITTGGNLSVFGYNAQASSATATNEVTLGNASVATLRCQVTTITALSDFRDKTDINNVEVGLSFVEKLRPVTFKWDKREWYTDGNRDGSKKDTITQIGFIAQELKALQESENATYLNLVYESNPDKLEATPGNLMVPLIKAVQELSVMVKQQRVEFDDKITKQQLEIDYLKSKLNN